MDIKMAAWAWNRIEGRALGHNQKSVFWKPIHRELLIAIES